MKNVVIVGLVLFLAISLAGIAGETAPDPWKPVDLLQPTDLARRIRQGRANEVVQVGFGVLYRSKHIPGSIYAGPASKPEGIEHLLEAVKNLDRSTPLVIYCGCCPFDRCPNVRPAYTALLRAGFDHVRVLELPQSFGSDWVEKGYPVERGAGRTP